MRDTPNYFLSMVAAFVIPTRNMVAGVYLSGWGRQLMEKGARGMTKMAPLPVGDGGLPAMAMKKWQWESSRVPAEWCLAHSRSAVTLDE